MDDKRRKNESKHISGGFTRRELLIGAGCIAATCGAGTLPAKAVRAFNPTGDEPVFSFQTGPLGFPH